MTKQIFKAVCLAAIAVFGASLVIIMGALYGYFSEMQMKQIRIQSELAARGVENNGLAYLDSLKDEEYRVTWIAADGTVKYDSRTDGRTMENHLEREEIREALSGGIGESARYSSTLMEQQLYCARKLADGTVLRLSDTVYLVDAGFGNAAADSSHSIFRDRFLSIPCFPFFPENRRAFEQA